MLLDVCVGIVQKIQASVDVGKISNAQTVARIKLCLQIVAASVSHIGQLKQVGCG